MKKTIKLTESDLTKLIEQMVKENMEDDSHIPFHGEELEDIKSSVMRLTQPGFFEDYEVCGYLLRRSHGDRELAHRLVKWLETQGIDLFNNRCLFDKKVVTESEDPDMSEFRKFVPLLQKINNRIDMKEVVKWFNMNDIDYIGMNDLQMIIIYIARNS